MNHVGPYPSRSRQVGVGQGPYPPYPPNMQGAAPPVVAPLMPLPTTLQAGHRYSITLSPPPGGIPSVQQVQAMYDAVMPGTIQVVSVTQDGTTVFDVLQSISWSTTPVTDLGPTPAPVPVIPPPVPIPTPVTPIPGGSGGAPIPFTFSAGLLPQGISPSPGTPVVFMLPAGATWQSLSVDMLGTMGVPSGPAVTPGTSTPVTIPTPPGPATVSAMWLDSTGTRQIGAAIFLPPGVSLSTPITDTGVVTTIQNLMNQLAATPQVQAPGEPPPVQIQPVAVNGNAADPGFVSQLSAMQQWLVNAFANPPAPAPGLPALGPTAIQIPTNGTLDYATLAALSLPL